MALHFREATGIFRKTLPFVLLRIGVGVLLGILAVVYFGILLWALTTFAGSGSISSLVLIVGLGLGALLFYGAWKLLSKYLFYMIKAAHIAVIAHVVETGEVPENQVQFGKDRVKEHFAEASALFAVDQLVKGIVEELNDAALSITNWLPTTTSEVQQLVRIVTKAVSIAANYIDEAIVAYLFVDDEENKWRSAKDGVVLYGKNWKPVLGSTLLIVGGMYAATFVVLLALSPLAGVLGGRSQTVEALGWVVVGGAGLTLYSGLLKPWVKTVVITTFLMEAQDQEPDSETVDWLRERSSKFEELLGRIEDEEEAEGDAEPAAPEPEATA